MSSVNHLTYEMWGELEGLPACKISSLEAGQLSVWYRGANFRTLFILIFFLIVEASSAFILCRGVYLIFSNKTNGWILAGTGAGGFMSVFTIIGIYLAVSEVFRSRELEINGNTVRFVSRSLGRNLLLEDTIQNVRVIALIHNLLSDEDWHRCAVAIAINIKASGKEELVCVQRTENEDECVQLFRKLKEFLKLPGQIFEKTFP